MIEWMGEIMDHGPQRDRYWEDSHIEGMIIGLIRTMMMVMMMMPSMEWTVMYPGCNGLQWVAMLHPRESREIL